MRLSLGFSSIVLAVGLFGPRAPLQAQEKTGKNLLLALEGSLQEVIKQTEPSVACILVSRNPVYKNEFDDRPPADQPGKLGGFDPTGKPDPLRINNNQFGRGRRGGFGFREPPDPVQARRYDLSYFGYVPEAYGSGLVIDGEQLLILTAYHVIRDATKIYVRLPGEKGSYADILAADPLSDLAVISLIDRSVKPLKAVKFGNGGDAKKGQIVVAIANPFAAGFRDGSPSASWGIISNIQRRAASLPSPIELAEGQPTPFTKGAFLRTDAQILAGSSGGALVNLNGEVIGLISARAALSGLEGNGGFAIPIDKATKSMINRLQKGEEVEHGFLGIQASPDGKRGAGALVGDVTPGCPAALAGITSKDCIVAINGTPIRDFDDLVLTVSTELAGSEARVEIRDRTPAIIPVKLAKTYVPGFIATNRPKPVRGVRVDYTSIYMIKHANEDLRRAGPDPNTQGVIVTEVLASSAAENVLIKVEDLIIAVNGEPVSNPTEFYQKAAKIASDKPLVLTVASRNPALPDSKIVVP